MMVTVRNIELHSIDRERMALGALAQANITSRGIESINAPNEHTVNNTHKKNGWRKENGGENKTDFCTDEER